jgi:hypothetical protein
MPISKTPRTWRGVETEVCLVLSIFAGGLTTFVMPPASGEAESVH